MRAVCHFSIEFKKKSVFPAASDTIKSNCTYSENFANSSIANQQIMPILVFRKCRMERFKILKNGYFTGRFRLESLTIISQKTKVRHVGNNQSLPLLWLITGRVFTIVRQDHFFAFFVIFIYSLIAALNTV